MARHSRGKKPDDGGKEPGEAEIVSAEDLNASLRRFSPRQRQIIRLKWEHPTLRIPQIAKLIGITESAVYQHFHSGELDSIVATIDKDLYRKVHVLREAALDKYRELLHCGNKFYEYSVARDLLSILMNSQQTMPQPLLVDEVLFVDPADPGKKVKA